MPRDVQQISIDRLYTLLLDTAQRGSSRVRSLPDEELEYNLFEEFDVGAHSFFHEASLNRLQEAGRIDVHVASLCAKARELWLSQIQANDRSTVQQIRSDPKWDQLFECCDGIVVRLEALHLDT